MKPSGWFKAASLAAFFLKEDSLHVLPVCSSLFVLGHFLLPPLINIQMTWNFILCQALPGWPDIRASLYVLFNFASIFQEEQHSRSVAFQWANCFCVLSKESTCKKTFSSNLKQNFLFKLACIFRDKRKTFTQMGAGPRIHTRKMFIKLALTWSDLKQ